MKNDSNPTTHRTPSRPPGHIQYTRKLVRELHEAIDTGDKTRAHELVDRLYVGTEHRWNPWTWDSPVKIAKPDRFEGEVHARLMKWLQDRGYSPRVYREALNVWEDWTEPVSTPKTRTAKSWQGSFRRMLTSEVRAGRIALETKEERVEREAREFRERAAQPGLGL